MFYQTSLTALRKAILATEPDCTSKDTGLKPGSIASLSYLLWMCEEVKKMDVTSIDECAKAGRWVGWIFAHAELANLWDAGPWDNARTRDLVREDRRLGFDKPHQD